MLRTQFFMSSSPLSMLRNSRSSIPLATASASAWISGTCDASDDSAASSRSVCASSSLRRSEFHPSSHILRRLICCMIFWAATLSFQKSGAWVRASKSATSFSFVARSKIPPECIELGGERIQRLVKIVEHVPSERKFFGDVDFHPEEGTAQRLSLCVVFQR